MRNSRQVGSFVLAGVGIGTAVWLALRPGNTKMQNLYSNVKNKFFPSPSLATPPIEKAGHPDPHDVDDNKMVSEGAMYSVNYYNEKEQ